jgi:hypothetical protein
MTWSDIIQPFAAGCIGGALAITVQEWFARRRRRILNSWETGMVIDTSDGERLYVCHVEPTPSGSEGER